MSEYNLTGHMEPHEIEAFYESPLAPLYPRLRRGMFHRMSIESYRQVMEDGFIYPNKAGERIPCTTCRSATSFGGKRGLVSVFDFYPVQDHEFALHEGSWGCGWGTFLYYDFEPITVVLELDREALMRDLIPNSVAKLPEFFMPRVEAWYPDAIPVSAIKSRILIVKPHPDVDGLTYREVSEHGEGLERAIEMLVAGARPYTKPRSPMEDWFASQSPEEIQRLYEKAAKIKAGEDGTESETL